MNRVSMLVVVAAMAGAIGLAQLAKQKAYAMAGKSKAVTEPYAPSVGAAPFVSLGYREATADLMSLRLVGYFADEGDRAVTTAGLVEAVEALDPNYLRIYEFGARAITLAETGVDNAAYMRAIGVLQRGSVRYPDNWKLPYLASQIYLQDLTTTDAAQRRSWDEQGLLLAEAAIHKPKAPASLATFIATMRTRMGQTERAKAELREMLLVTEDASARAQLLKKLAALEADSSDELAAELLSQRKAFDRAWKAHHPGISATLYSLLGDTPATFDLAALATGPNQIDFATERLPPLTDPPAPAVDAPAPAIAPPPAAVDPNRDGNAPTHKPAP